MAHSDIDSSMQAPARRQVPVARARHALAQHGAAEGAAHLVALLGGLIQLLGPLRVLAVLGAPLLNGLQVHLGGGWGRDGGVVVE